MKTESEGHKSSPKKISLEPRAWVNLGYSIANSKEGTFFLKNAIPGETVLATLLKKSGSLTWGVGSEILTKSSERIISDCSVFPKCGGCSYRHISYEKELEVKKFLLKETLERSFSKNHIQIPEIEILSGDPTGYRNTAQIPLGFSGSKRVAGFYEEFSHSIVPLPEDGCKNLPKEMNLAVSEFLKKEKSGSTRSSKAKTLSFRLDEKNIVSYRNESVVFRETIRTSNPKDIIWEIPPNGFSQINRFLIPRWLEKIYELVPEDSDSILELYCGSGLISVALHDKTKNWIGYELSKDSVKQAKKNLAKNGLSPRDFRALDLEAEPIPEEDLNSSFWIANPPRAGLSKKVVQAFRNQEPKAFLYSSCNHTTLARDLADLCRDSYLITKIILVDFFPRTKHFEVIVKIEKR
ncbi:class I SAM-dependent RNA methyltransferase [Leptospira adleri]|uniref:TrmA/RlmC/RlmD family RNA methyltransferase n=1 Tax=Leptospira adleri TaxID=2023186 RepID=A0ABX4NWP7_9LEPT|nr:methyltransferase domain-containing protein [Leptospira adleri]PJZ61117.1 TrmA/RlmC/RlmD family RNA methyltransferase [Leptospira adleri]